MNLYEYTESVKNKRIAVIGAGISNRPLIKLLLMSGCNVTVCDKKSPEEISNEDLELISLGAAYKFGETYLANLDYDIIFRTPGLMPFDPNLVSAREKGSIITSEMEVFFSLCPCKTIAVTGSDGKTTTSTIISEILKKAGYSVHLGGNIGHPLLCDVPFMKKEDIAVLELSSFQLHSMYCRPNVSVITNISPNHIDKHKTYEDYVEAKKQIVRNQTVEDTTVINYSDSECRKIVPELKSVVKFFGSEKVAQGYYLEDRIIYRANEDEVLRVMDSSEILLPGKHNVMNYLAAFTAVDGLVDIETCIDVARSFKGVEHRLELVRELNGVKYINDSIGTSPTRTVAGLNSFNVKPIVILGGYDKGIPFNKLGDEVCKNAKAAVLMGATADTILKSILESKDYEKSGIQIIKADGLKDALLKAKEISVEGDIILMSPACAAFDCFKNFEERGRYFKQLVMEL